MKKKAPRRAPVKVPRWPARASVFEVGPRDGLQSEPVVLKIEDRIRLVKSLFAAGLLDVEVGSFVKPELLPQVASTAEIVKAVKSSGVPKRARLWAFVPNAYGLKQAFESGVDGVSFFVATSDTFCRKNVNRSQMDILADLAGLLATARKMKLSVRVYLSTIVYCPYEGTIAPAKVVSLVRKLRSMGAKEIVLSDTTGHATPRSMRGLLTKLLAEHPASLFALHLHDTRGLALGNILEGLNHGLSRFDSSIGGMGGCPYAPGASGNLSTEDLVYMLNGMGLDKSIELAKLGTAGRLAQSLVGRELPSRVLKTLKE